MVDQSKECQMKRRIRRIKGRLYPMFIDEAIRRKAWEPVRIAHVRFSDAMREAYAKARAGLEQPWVLDTPCVSRVPPEGEKK
jgi:hypothetical protein